MNQRNWPVLGRLLVDTPDLDYDVQGQQDGIANAVQAMVGEGVLSTALVPSPFAITMSGSVLGGTVGTGNGVDPNGQLVQIPSASPFTITPADATHARWDLLVLEYTQTGDTPVPQPSNPANTVFLNLHDDFILKVIAGTPGASPAYPSKGASDIILAGLKVPANATLGTGVTVDLSQRELAFHYKAPTQTQILYQGTGPGNYTVKAGCLYYRVRMWGAGGGGGDLAASANGGKGGDTVFGPTGQQATAAGGGGGLSAANTSVPAPGRGGQGDISFLGFSLNGFAMNGNPGESVSPISGASLWGGNGGVSNQGGGGQGGNNANAPLGATDFSGSGGGGAGQTGSGGGGGAAGGFCDFYVYSPAGGTVIPYNVGGPGTAGGANSSEGGSGMIIIDEFYQ